MPDTLHALCVSIMLKSLGVYLDEELFLTQKGKKLNLACSNGHSLCECVKTSNTHLHISV
jgi:acetone carboxylase gamma subunit